MGIDASQGAQDKPKQGVAPMYEALGNEAYKDASTMALEKFLSQKKELEGLRSSPQAENTVQSGPRSQTPEAQGRPVDPSTEGQPPGRPIAPLRSGEQQSTDDSYHQHHQETNDEPKEGIAPMYTDLASESYKDASGMAQDKYQSDAKIIKGL